MAKMRSRRNVLGVKTQWRLCAQTPMFFERTRHMHPYNLDYHCREWHTYPLVEYASQAPSKKMG